ncbi:hypothetical protein; putative exported protein [Frankia alni ACN14a]|uniref:Uncharacterized protein n=1 Tax=Frankia alni (strain DSM 45986 / CECT 9034 / ACN14a) TaxID=326424 RepID=Q0RAM1_FRAAA|nr:hypothetical protein; putative exported protein [Frankia alni ACN14a]
MSPMTAIVDGAAPALVGGVALADIDVVTVRAPAATMVKAILR